MNTLTFIQFSLLGLTLISLTIGFYSLIKTLKSIYQQQTKINQTLEDIASSQRILANNPRDFEETKRISQNKRDLNA